MVWLLAVLRSATFCGRKPPATATAASAAVMDPADAPAAARMQTEWLGTSVGIVALGEFPFVQRLEQEIDDAGGVRAGRDRARHGKADLVDILVVSHVILRWLHGLPDRSLKATLRTHSTLTTGPMRKPTRARPLLAYVGSYTTPERHGEGNGINVYRVDRRTGAFSHLQHLGGLENPSFLAINADGTRLYSVHGDRSEINSFTIDPRTGHLAPLNRQPTGGYNPVHLAFDATGRFLAVCNYGTDSLAVFPLADDGSLLPYRTLTTVTGTLGPHRIQQRTMCVHHIPLDAQGRFFYVPCKGSDAVIAYRLDTRRKILVEAARVTARPGAAPRHIDFHPAKALAYVINELEFDDHHLSPGSAKRRAHAAADDPGHAVGVHRLQHGRRDLGRSRRPQCLRLQSRP